MSHFNASASAHQKTVLLLQVTKMCKEYGNGTYANALDENPLCRCGKHPVCRIRFCPLRLFSLQAFS
jgi:hypothetical protein